MVNIIFNPFGIAHVSLHGPNAGALTSPNCILLWANNGGWVGPRNDALISKENRRLLQPVGLRHAQAHCEFHEVTL
jgi:hypothetical protein